MNLSRTMIAHKKLKKKFIILKIRWPTLCLCCYRLLRLLSSLLDVDVDVINIVVVVVIQSRIHVVG